MTRAEAEQALEIARNALREVGGDPACLYVGERHPGEFTISYPWASAEGWRAAAIGVSAMRPGVEIACRDHRPAPRKRLPGCVGITAADAARGRTSCEAETA